MSNKHPQPLEEEEPCTYPRTGSVISIHVKSKGEIPATVTQSSPDEVCLELARPVWHLLFQEGLQVRIKYWDEAAIVYFWEAKIIGAAKRGVLARLLGVGVTVQRRQSYRVRTKIRLACTVIDAADRYLVGKAFKCKTKDISVGGLAFKTYLPLDEGDRLAVNIHFSSLHQIDVVGWIVRATPIERHGEVINSVAVQFLHCEAEDQNHLLRFLAHGEVS
ncbi:MAG: PilZ domain-containing protein [Acidobacteria bacterium]|nr:PilZ domain-containing protein [Acidobacteriota bacterium]